MKEKILFWLIALAFGVAGSMTTKVLNGYVTGEELKDYQIRHGEIHATIAVSLAEIKAELTTISEHTADIEDTLKVRCEQ